MRVTADARQLEVDPGSRAVLGVDVVNTGAVIDGVSTRVIGLPEQYVSAQPALLPLFPDTSGRVTLSLDVPATLPAGRHPLSVEVVSHGAKTPSQFVDLDLDVRSRPRLTMAARPRVARARRGARFVLELTNGGNVALDVALTAADADRATTTTFTPSAVQVPAGATVPVLLNVRGPRMITGTELDRTVTVAATAHSVDTWTADGTGDGPDTLPVAVPETTVRLRQRPLLSRGLLTALILLAIVGLWAGVFLLGLTKVFSGDPMTKQAPASFFLPAGSSGAGGAAAGSGGSGGTSGGGSGKAAAAPPGALPKSGQMPPGTGGAISGTVTAASDGRPVSRILVQALRRTRSGLEVASSAATQSDGTYSVAGLFPTDYLLKFSAPGFKTIWYPAAPGQSGARAVPAQAQGNTTGVNATITGLPASISGTVNPGDTLNPVTTTVTARSLSGIRQTSPHALTTTTHGGSYTIRDLIAPGSYELTFTTPGYQTSTIVDTVNGGDTRLEPAITLGAAAGQIEGTVTDGSKPLGGATVSTTVAGKPLTVTTPTTGQVGHYLIGGLPTPGTYVITFSAPGHGAQTKIVELTAGQSRGGVGVSLAAGTGTVSGTLVDTDGNGLGGATVTVGGTAIAAGGAAPSTVTLTSDTGKGGFVVNNLSAPGSYTLTFSLAGYQSTTIPITLNASGPPPTVTATLLPQNGSIKGTVIKGGKDLAGATVAATDGRTTWKSTSTDSGFVISGLAPGHYSVTATYAGLQQQTALVVVRAGKASSAILTLAGG
ncbi:MAG TPA: carboxypeptidase-like regulatory domain-containing protein [Jatrophihabitantaceae bacterium]|nr:carboxypeptidase-like regulatory domain-containing protein [Jatrophihabitantaceae bacterium]